MGKEEKKEKMPVRAVRVIDPFAEMDEMRRRMDSMFDDFLTVPRHPVGRFGMRMPTLRQPLADLEEHKDKYVAIIEAPGLNKEDFVIEVEPGMLRVHAQRKKEEKEEKKGYAYHERSYSGYYRQFSLPQEINPDKAKAKYSDGILRIELPKMKLKTKKGKKVKVK
ncbi:MAG: Hsp20/alpha crystallin family protein [Candidatus Micrarchaeota archaeon]